MVKIKFANNQLAFEYALYMITSSYFKKTSCITSLLEKKLFLYYNEQKSNTQYHMEDLCIRHIEQELLHNIPKSLWNETVKVRLIKHPNQNCTEIQFIGESYILRLKGTYCGKTAKIEHEIWSTKQLVRRKKEK